MFAFIFGTFLVMATTFAVDHSERARAARLRQAATSTAYLRGAL
jgi:hypothetical protein